MPTMRKYKSTSTMLQAMKQSATKTGKKLTPEHREAISLGRKRALLRKQLQSQAEPAE